MGVPCSQKITRSSEGVDRHVDFPDQAFRNDSNERNEKVTIPFFLTIPFFSKRNWTERGTRQNLGLLVQFLFIIYKGIISRH